MPGEYRESDRFLEEVHRQVVDSVYPTQRYNKYYKNIIEEKSNALLMDEDTMNFYHYNLNIQPQGIVYAVNYIRSILTILSRYNGEFPKDLIRQLKNMKLVRKEDYLEESPHEIVMSYEEISFHVKNKIYWTEKIARYLSHCMNGGLLCSNFTLNTLIKMMANVTESQDEINLKDEIAYLLHLREKSRKFERTQEPITSIIKSFIANSHEKQYVFNEKVLIVLIESGYL